MSRGRKPKYGEPMTNVSITMPKRLLANIDMRTDNRSDYIVRQMEMSAGMMTEEEFDAKIRVLNAEIDVHEDRLAQLHKEKRRLEMGLSKVRTERGKEQDHRIALLEQVNGRIKSGASPSMIIGWLEGPANASKITLAGFHSAKEVVECCVKVER